MMLKIAFVSEGHYSDMQSACESDFAGRPQASCRIFPESRVVAGTGLVVAQTR